MGAYVRLYDFLSQIFNCGNTAIEARSIFYRRLAPYWSSAASGRLSIPRTSC